MYFNEGIFVAALELARWALSEQSELGAVEIQCPAWAELACRHEDRRVESVRADARDGPALSGVSARTVRRAVAVRFG
jgi:hypothetical protein